MIFVLRGGPWGQLDDAKDQLAGHSGPSLGNKIFFW